jgi:hypothetical protein
LGAAVRGGNRHRKGPGHTFRGLALVWSSWRPRALQTRLLRLPWLMLPPFQGSSLSEGFSSSRLEVKESHKAKFPDFVHSEKARFHDITTSRLHEKMSPR